MLSGHFFFFSIRQTELNGLKISKLININRAIASLSLNRVGESSIIMLHRKEEDLGVEIGVGWETALIRY